MPNWCYNHITIYSENRKDVVKLTEFLQKTADENPVENGFGGGWLGNLLYNIGLDWKSIRCRGHIIEDPDPELIPIEPISCDYGDIYDISIQTETAWSPHIEFWETFLEEFNKKNLTDLEFVDVSEEPGEPIYINTDVKHVFYEEKYHFYASFNGEKEELYEEYYTSYTDLIEGINKWLSNNDLDIRAYINEDIKDIEKRIGCWLNDKVDWSEFSIDEYEEVDICQ